MKKYNSEFDKPDFAGLVIVMKRTQVKDALRNKRE